MNLSEEIAHKTYNNGNLITLKDVWFLGFAHDAYEFCFQVPLEKCIWGYGWRYTPEEHPFFHAFGQEEFLDTFYYRYRPQSALEAVILQPGHGGWESLFVPWRCTIKPPKKPEQHPFIEDGGTQHYGPVSLERLNREKRRLSTVLTSIQEIGYQGGNGEHDHIRGYFMVQDDDFLFYIGAGKHRAAALLKLGYTSLPATFSIFVPRMPRLISHQHLELLAGKVYDRRILPTVKTMFDGYFNEGIRQRRKSLLASWIQ
ncbi:hypothetical protein [Sodalinema gerasimenkoae]|uniref:hypothetical protein n=1 Tax=Sodalinema gerasimenkoae TaxID=2862348 RepID=UPI001357AF1D|nr:hypothetical protein [Sodalinema gerasimenkoae]